MAGRSHSHEHTANSAKIFNQLHPIVVGAGSLTLFPGTELGEEARRGEFDPLTEKEMMEELKIFLENLECDARLITHHTVATNLSEYFGRIFQLNRIFVPVDGCIEKLNFGEIIKSQPLDRCR